MNLLAKLYLALRRRPFALIAAIGALNAFLVASPAVSSGFSWDDNVVSTFRGAVRASGRDLPAVMLSGIRDLFSNQGRLFPLSSIGTLPLYFFDRFGYKLSIVALVFLNLALFSRLAARISGERTIFAFALLLAPTVLQTRYGPDAIQGYHWVLQLVLLWTTLSLLAFVTFLKERRRAFLVASLVFFECALLTYEVAYAFFILFAVLAVGLRSPGRSRLSAVWGALPFVGLVLLTASGVFAARQLAGMPLVGVNGAYIPSRDAGAFAATLLRHCSAALPASYTLFSPLRSVEHAPAASVWAALMQNFGPLHVWLLCSQTLAALLYARAKPAAPCPMRVAVLGTLGASLWVTAGVLITLSPKYQGRNWIDWGMSYLPVYISFFGVLAILVAAVSFVRRPLTLCAVGAISGIVSIWTYQSNAQVVTQINAAFRFPREYAELALRNGVFDAVPANAYLVVGSDAYPGANPSFFRTHVDVPMRRAVGKGNFLGGALNDPSYFARLFNPTGRVDVPLPNRVIGPDGFASHQFTASDGVYYFAFANGTSAGGYALTARLVELTASDTELRSARADELLVNLSPDWPSQQRFEITIAAGAERRTISLPGQHTPVKKSRCGSLFSVRAVDGETIDVLSVSVR